MAQALVRKLHTWPVKEELVEEGGGDAEGGVEPSGGVEQPEAAPEAPEAPEWLE